MESAGTSIWYIGSLMGCSGDTVTIPFFLVNNIDYLTPFTGPVSVTRIKEDEKVCLERYEQSFRINLLPYAFDLYKLELFAEEFEHDVNYILWIREQGAADLFLYVKRNTIPIEENKYGTTLFTSRQSNIGEDATD